MAHIELAPTDIFQEVKADYNKTGSILKIYNQIITKLSAGCTVWAFLQSNVLFVKYFLKKKM